MVKEPITILLIEDSKTDADLIKRQIWKAAHFPKIRHISRYEQLGKALAMARPDIILCDYNLQGHTGLDVLEFVKGKVGKMPFVFVTGTLNNEELAAETILSGASGYILKKHMNELHTKLLPHFQAVVSMKEIVDNTLVQRKDLDDFIDYAKNLKKDSRIIRAELERLNKFLEEIDQRRSGQA